MKQTMRVVLIAALGVVLTGSAPEADTMTQSLPIKQGQKVTMELDFGRIEVRTAESGELKVTVTSQANKADEVVLLSLEATTDGVRVAGKRKGSGGGWFSGWHTSALKTSLGSPERVLT